MQQSDPNQDKRRKQKPFLVSYGLVILIMLLLNTFLFPSILKSQVQEVDSAEGGPAGR